MTTTKPPVDEIALKYVNEARAQHEMSPITSILAASDTELLWGFRRAIKAYEQARAQSRVMDGELEPCFFCGEGMVERKYNSDRRQPSPDAANVIKALLEALEGCTTWMEQLRASGDSGFWDWNDDEYTRAIAAIALAKAHEGE